MKIYFAEWNAEYEKLMFNMLHTESTFEIIVLNNLMKHFRNYNLKLKRKNINNKWLVKIHKFFKLRHIRDDDIIVCNGFSVAGIIDLIKDINCRKVLVIRDTIDVLENSMKYKKQWLDKNQSYINEVVPYFDKVYSFDQDDCRKYHFQYLEQFLPFTYTGIKKMRDEPIQEMAVLTCFFVGEYWDNRVTIINQLAPILTANSCKIDFYLVHYSNEAKDTTTKSKNYQEIALSYQDNIKKSISSDIILEINHEGQSGVSLRTIEAMLLNKKLITTNKAVKHHEYYNPNQIFILDNNYDELPAFLKLQFKPVEIKRLYQNTADGMLIKIIKEYL